MREQVACPRVGVAYRWLLWLVVAAAVAALIYGFASTNLFASDTWSKSGRLKFQTFTSVVFVTYAGLAIVLRRYIVLAIFVPILVFTICGTGAIAFLSVLLLCLSSALLGRCIFRTHSWTLAFLGGLCTWALGIGVLAHVRIHYASVYLGIHGIVLLARRRELLCLLSDLRRIIIPTQPLSWGAVVGFGAVIYTFAAHWILIWKPETAGDALAMHLAIALNFSNNHVFSFDYHEYIWSLLPMGADYCYAAAAVLGGEYAARLLNLTMFGVVAHMIFTGARRWVSRDIACLLTALFVSAPLAQLVTGSMFVENFTAALAIGALLALWEFSEYRSAGALCLCALLLGSGIGWKLGGIAIAMGLLPFVLWAALRNRANTQRVGSSTAVAAGLLFAIPAVLPYAKAYVLTGNPVFPFGNPIFTSPLIQDYLVDYRFHQPLTWRILFDLTFHTQRYYEGQNGSFAFQYLLLAPISLVALWKARTFEERSVVLAGFVAAVAIASTEPNARYFYPVLPLIMVAGAVAVGVVRASDKRLFATCVALLVVLGAINVWFLPTSNWHHRDFYLRPLFAERGRVEYLRSMGTPREVVPFLNRTSGGVLFTQSSEIAGVRQPTFSNHWHNLRLRKIIETARNTEHLYRAVRKEGISHFVKGKQVSAAERRDSVALFEFLDLCGEPEFETPTHFVLAIASDCEARLARSAPNFANYVLGPGEYDDDDRRVDYRGTWDPGRDRFPNSYGNTVSFSKEQGAEIRIEFEGSAFVYGFTTAFNRGRAEIRMDGQLVDVLDQYSPAIRWQSRKQYTLQRTGRHFVSIRATGAKDPRATEAYIDLDFFVIEP